MSCLLLGKFLFNATDNHVNMMAYKKLCNEFNVNVNSDFRFKGGDNGVPRKVLSDVKKKITQLHRPF